MDSYSWVMYAGVATWTGIGLYLCFLARKQTALTRRMERMAQMMEPSHEPSPSTDNAAAHAGREEHRA